MRNFFFLFVILISFSKAQATIPMLDIPEAAVIPDAILQPKLAKILEVVLRRYDGRADIVPSKILDRTVEVGPNRHTFIDVIKMDAPAQNKKPSCSLQFFPAFSIVHILCAPTTRLLKLTIKAKVENNFELVTIRGEDVTVDLDRGLPSARIIKGSIPFTRFTAIKNASGQITDYGLTTSSK